MNVFRACHAELLLSSGFCESTDSMACNDKKHAMSVPQSWIQRDQLSCTANLTKLLLTVRQHCQAAGAFLPIIIITVTFKQTCAVKKCSFCSEPRVYCSRGRQAGREASPPSTKVRELSASLAIIGSTSTCTRCMQWFLL